MQMKISKTLEGVLARAAFNTAKAGITRSLKDHLAVELLREEGSLAFQLLSSRLKEWEVYQIRLRIEHEIAADRSPGGDDPEAFFRSFREELCEKSGAVRSISTVHALRFIAADAQTATARALEMYGVTAEIIAADLQKFAVGDDFRPGIQVRMLDFSAADRPEPKDEPHLLDKFGADLTRLAREGRIDPVVGREEEIERVVQILSRRKKNNPILIGEAGVGKSAIVEGLALRIAAGEVPYTIAGKTLFSLDISSLVAGTKFRGEFEERMQQLLDELRKAKDTIIFIDEIHTIVGAGSTQGSLDTANILKPALARGELQTIGATTLDEYRENIESDSALERRFQKVVVEPTTAGQTLEILRNIAPHYERHHKVRYTDAALRACVALTERYITDRFFPDKAIDVMDEAGSRVHLRSACEPDELRRMETAVGDVQRERCEAVGAMAYDKAASARMREIALRSRIDRPRSEWRCSLETNPAEIGEEEIREVITAMTGIPAERVTDGEAGRLRTLCEHLSGRVVGQQDAVEKISRTIRRSRAGLKDEKRPIGVFLFVGPTGVCKTLLAKEVS
ncbi:MAG: ATP-dependent Clp protease ATP-binding subunit, partial [Alistipes sp.]|nr:ATP-dependent Clp protease ATP-binding subunit [Alistipes sp.]